MDGYAICETPEEAFACFGKEGVRHVAELSTGEGFVAFDGPIPLEKATILANVDENEFWWTKVRRLTPELRVRRGSPFGGIGREHLGLFSTREFLALPAVHVEMASPIVGGWVLAITTREESSALWSAYSTSYRDIRVNEGALVKV